MTGRRRAAAVVSGAAGVLLALTACSGSATSAAPVGSAGSTSSPTGTPSPGSTSAPSGSASGPVSVSGSAPSAAAFASPSAAQNATTNVYAAAGAGMLAPAVRGDAALVYVPDTIANRVEVIDPATMKVIRSFPTTAVAQHVVPSWDLKTLWVNESTGNRLTPIDARTGKQGKPVVVDDPYNLYFTPDGAHAMVMAERLRRIDFRDPHTMTLQHSLPVPCRGVNHADFTADLTTFVASCEFSGRLIVVPASGAKVTTVIDLNAIRTPGMRSPHEVSAMGGPAVNVDHGTTSMPQDVRLLPDGSAFVAADMIRDGIWVIDAKTFTVRRFVRTGKGAHGIYPSRDASVLYVSNRDEGSVSVLDAHTLAQKAVWRIPGGGSPDMGGVSADGTRLWLSGRSHSVVYVFDTATGRVLKKIPVHAGPHGLCVWPQPGRFSLGHTGNLR